MAEQLVFDFFNDMVEDNEHSDEPAVEWAEPLAVPKLALKESDLGEVPPPQEKATRAARVLGSRCASRVSQPTAKTSRQV